VSYKRSAVNLQILTTIAGGAWDRSTQSTCVDLQKLAFATGGIAVVFDILILALPVPELLHLNMNRRKKMHVLFMFSLGSM